MKKEEFLYALKMKLSGLPKQDVEERLNFYSEIIDDRMEEGCTEEEAVSGIGSVDEISVQIIRDVPLIKIAKERINPKRKLKAWEIVLLALGSPIWLSLGIALAAIVLSLYVVLWSVVISLWAVFVALAACAFGGILTCIVFSINGNALAGIAIVGAGIVCAGFAVFMFFGCKATTKGILLLTKKIALNIKKGIVKKEDAQ